MLVNGVDLGSLSGNINVDKLIPDVVPHRILQLDGDMLAYECCGDDEQPFAYCIENWKTALNVRRAMAGAEYCNIHLTGADKGGRFDTALVRPYQGNREGKIKPKHLPQLREWVQMHYHSDPGMVPNEGARCVYNENQEADDGMAQRQYEALQEDARHLSIIMSGDKDLGICSGLHCDWSTFDIVDIDGFGGTYLDDTGSTKKVKGKGTSFFWAQLLMGDTADNIPGLPTFGKDISANLWPSASFTEAQRVLTERTTKTGKPCTSLQIAKAQEVLDTQKAKACGPVAVHDYLKDTTNDLDAMMLCIRAYQSHYGAQPFDFTCHRGEQYRLTSGHMLLEQARLLWMRRVEAECPSVFFKQVIERIKWDGRHLEPTVH